MHAIITETWDCSCGTATPQNRNHAGRCCARCGRDEPMPAGDPPDAELEALVQHISVEHLCGVYRCARASRSFYRDPLHRVASHREIDCHGRGNCGNPNASPATEPNIIAADAGWLPLVAAIKATLPPPCWTTPILETAAAGLRALRIERDDARAKAGPWLRAV